MSPVYVYQCKECGHKFEEFQKFSDKPIKKCIHCGKESLEKTISKSSFILKGTGWGKDGK